MNSLKEIHDGFVAAAGEHFGDVLRTVDAYAPEHLESVRTPALLLELEDWDEGDDIGDGRSPLRCRFTAHCLLSFQTPNASLEVREFGARVQQLVRYNRWGLGDDADVPAQVSGAPGLFRPGKAGYESWCVSWEQVVYLGASAWAAEGVPPTEVFVGIQAGSDANNYEPLT